MAYALLQIEFFVPLVVRLMLYIPPSAGFPAFDTSLAVELKAQGDVALLGSYGRKKFSRVVAWSCFNVLLSVALQAGIEWPVIDVLKLRSILVIKGSVWSFNHLLNPWTMAKSIAEGLILQNASVGN